MRDVEVLLNPVLLVEVLSDSTTNHDLGAKFREHQAIESFEEYLVIAQDRPHVIQHIKPLIGWLRLDTIGLESTVKLTSIEAEIGLREIYQRVKFLAA
jgi:Uma2 family endonuclease